MTHHRVAIVTAGGSGMEPPWQGQNEKKSAQGAKGEFPTLICDFAQVVENCEEAKDIFATWKKERDKSETDLRARAEDLKQRIQQTQQKTKLSERDEKTYSQLQAAIEEKGQLEGEMAYKNVRDQDFFARKMQELMRGAKGVSLP